MDAVEYQHRPVLLEEVIENLVMNPDGIYVDGTFGRGGHSRAILARLSENGRLIALDRDPEAIASAGNDLKQDPRFSLIQSSFSRLGDVISQAGFAELVDGVLLDLGVSSPQLDDPERGFSFMKKGALDMRMDPMRGQSAATWLGKVDESELADIIYQYGEERFSRRIARAIVSARQVMPIEKTEQLVQIILNAVPKKEKHKHGATRTFQAIRIFINDELNELVSVLPQCLNLLKIQGRLAVISFHSLEDRIVKRFIQQESRGPKVSKYIPITREQKQNRLNPILKPIKPTDAEVISNPRSRSAILRIAEKMQ